ncbi:YtxH domain-containing protein [Falsibacillus pallidus]|uniref:Gas vesicle protein n=1 Tax=Falsibacillus pallidus TaxID=493781 RepID=A0A370GKW7_9BACI|nr:YtxH domain-containing protein [Falsibacillus pallidus]RDI44307.1 gas vesicle protein [Falsibacillus pallidus]
MAQVSETNTTERNDQNMNTKDFLIGALIGGIVGATTALFLAPKSGKELRDDLNLQAMQLKEKSSTFKDTAVEKGNEWAAVAKEKTSALSQAVQTNDLINKVKNLRTAGDAEPGETSDAGTTADDVNQKLEETKKAFDETEQSMSK